MWSDRPPLDAVIVADPVARPTTAAVSPTPMTSAIDWSLEVQITLGNGIGSPVGSPTDASSVMLPPTPTELGPEIRKYALPLEPAGGSAAETVVAAPFAT